MDCGPGPAKLHPKGVRSGEGVQVQTSLSGLELLTTIIRMMSDLSEAAVQLNS